MPHSSVHLSPSCTDGLTPDSLGGRADGGSPKLQKADRAPDTLCHTSIFPLLETELEGHGSQELVSVSRDVDRHRLEARHSSNCGTRCVEELCYRVLCTKAQVFAVIDGHGYTLPVRQLLAIQPDVEVLQFLPLKSRG